MHQNISKKCRIYAINYFLYNYIINNVYFVHNLYFILYTYIYIYIYLLYFFKQILISNIFIKYLLIILTLYICLTSSIEKMSPITTHMMSYYKSDVLLCISNNICPIRYIIHVIFLDDDIRLILLLTIYNT